MEKVNREAVQQPEMKRQENENVLDLSGESLNRLSMSDYAYDEEPSLLESMTSNETDRLAETVMLIDEAEVSAKDEAEVLDADDGLEVDFEFDFSTPDASENKRVEDGLGHAETIDDSSSLSLELDDADLSAEDDWVKGKKG